MEGYIEPEILAWPWYQIHKQKSCMHCTVNSLSYFKCRTNNHHHAKLIIRSILWKEQRQWMCDHTSTHITSRMKLRKSWTICCKRGSYSLVPVFTRAQPCKSRKRTAKGYFPTPLVEELLDELQGPKIYSKLDWNSGHLISAKGVSADPEKLRAMIEYPAPTNLQELRGFLRLTSYYLRFDANYGSLTAPLTQLLRMCVCGGVVGGSRGIWQT